MKKHEASRILRKISEIQADMDEELDDLLHSTKTDKTRYKRLDGILYGICLAVSFQTEKTTANIKECAIQHLKSIAYD